ncbi:MAG: hypothetical protein WCD76_20360 [Pyrinomonadaceae bacterium]
MKRDKTASCFPAFVLVVALAGMVAGQQTQDHSSHRDGQKHADCPMMQSGEAAAHAPHQHDGHETHGMAGMNERGDAAMGFEGAKTTHHFRLLSDGGEIEVGVNDAQDAASREQIRRHLAHIARAFAASDFSIPADVHEGVPPGVSVLKRSAASVKYQFEETTRGGRVRISTADREALAAVHEFLRFQITEHGTGDSLEVRER